MYDDYNLMSTFSQELLAMQSDREMIGFCSGLPAYFQAQLERNG
jgi:hypothetical protein